MLRKSGTVRQTEYTDQYGYVGGTDTYRRIWIKGQENGYGKRNRIWKTEKDLDTRKRIQGNGYKETSTRIRIQKLGFKESDIKNRITGIRYKTLRCTDWVGV